MSAPKPVPKTATGRSYVESGGAYRQAAPVAQHEVDYTKNGGADHAWRRHTRAGIWKAGRAETDHDSIVAVFADEAAFEAALAAMPTSSDQWQRGRDGRYDAYVGGVGYQAALLGNTMDLFTCYPLTGAKYGKRFIDKLLGKRGPKNADEFWALADMLDPLDARLDRLWRPPEGALDEEAVAYRKLAQAAEAAIEAASKAKAEELLDALSAKSHEIEAAIAERSAKAEAERKQREAPIAAMRSELNKLADAPVSEEGCAKAAELYAALMKAGTAINPATLRSIKEKYGIG